MVQDFTGFWIGISLAYLGVILLAVFGGKMIHNSKHRDHK